MKKLLLIAAAALIAGTASAQSLTTKPTGKAVQANRFTAINKAQKMSKVMPLPASKAAITREAQPRNAQMATAKFGKMQIASSNLKLSAGPRKVTSLLEAYLGTGADNRGNSQMWTATPCTVIDDLGEQSGGFQDLVANPFSSVADHLYVYYIDNDGVLSVPAQKVLDITFKGEEGEEDESYSIWICNYANDSDDGTIPLNVQGNGTMTIGTDYVAYVGLPVDAVEFSFDDMLWYWNYYTSIKYYDPNNIPTPEPTYAYDDLVLFSGVSASGYSFTYQHVMTPAYASVNTINSTTGVVENWDWKAYALEWDVTAGEDGDYVYGEAVATGNEKEFSYVTDPQYLYSPVELVASYGELASEPFYDTSDNALVYAGALGANWRFSDPDEAPSLSRANLKWTDGEYSLTVLPQDGIHSYVLYQGKPAAPFYFSGVNLLLSSFSNEENFNLKCKIQKVDRSSGRLVMGDVIAESEVDLNNINVTSWATELQWNNFQAEDEFGFKSDLDYIFVEDEFALVFEGIDNGTFAGKPIGDIGAPTGTTNSYVIVTGEEEFTGYGFQTYYGHIFAGFLGGTYGYLYTEDTTDLAIAADGGEASVHVTPMLWSTDEEGNPEARIWMESIVENEEELDEVPEWLVIGVANEDYSTDENGNVIDPSYDLVFSAAALPAGVESRSCEFVFVQEGAKLEVKVSQEGTATPDGITTVKVTPVKNGYYNIAGQRMSKPAKGIVIENGKKIVVK